MQHCGVINEVANKHYAMKWLSLQFINGDGQAYLYRECKARPVSAAAHGIGLVHIPYFPQGVQHRNTLLFRWKLPWKKQKTCWNKPSILFSRQAKSRHQGVTQISLCLRTEPSWAFVRWILRYASTLSTRRYPQLRKKFKIIPGPATSQSPECGPPHLG